MSNKKYAYSEIFHSIQGEGKYTGIPTAWLRFYLCNLQCDGFGQSNPKDPSTYKLPYKEIDISLIKTVEDLPVFQYGCDSSYSWSAKFKHLQHKGTSEEIAQRIRDAMKSEWNPEGLFNFNDTNQHFCLTGGEPLMKHAQAAFVELWDVFRAQEDVPHYITWETNGTQEIEEPTAKLIRSLNGWDVAETFFSVSPKLFAVSGEDNARAIRPDIVKSYYDLLPYNTRDDLGQLKFVINGTRDSWEELEWALNEFRKAGVKWPVYIMPVGATVEGQELVAGDVAAEAFKRGYRVSARVHTYLWGNKIGT